MNKMLTFFKTRIKKILNKDIYFYNLAKVNLRKYNFTKVEKYEISTGYSIVIIFAVLVLFISFTIAASVVDFPDPVGPVTSTKPLCISIIS